MKSDIMAVIQQLCEEKNISFEAVKETIEAALAAAYRKHFGDKNHNIKVDYNPEENLTKVYDVKTVVEDVSEEELEQALELKKKEKEGETFGEEIKHFNPKTEIMLKDAKLIKKSYKIGDEIITELPLPESYGRMAAQTAKQVIIQRIREAERDKIYEDFKKKEQTLINGTVQRREGRLVLVDLGQTVGIILPEDQVETENYRTGQRMNFFINSVNLSARGPEILLSRTNAEILRELFRSEVPEINVGTVEIKNVAREAGLRSKVAVVSLQSNIDPVGSCVGQRGTRVQTIINELGGEKIDIIEWSDDPEKFITNALSPAKIINIKLDEPQKVAVVQVVPDQFSLAIGRSGQNVRLASRLTGWRIEVASGEISPVIVEEKSDKKAEAVKEETKEEVKEEKKEEAPAVETKKSKPKKEAKKVKKAKK